MAYIGVEYGGKKTFGGYLSVDGDKQMVLSEGLLIKVGAGTHVLSYSSVPAANSLIRDLNVEMGNVGTVQMMHSNMIEVDIPIEVAENDLLTLKIVSDNNGKILSAPDYDIVEMNAEAQAEVDKLYNEQAAEGYRSDGSNVRTEFWICLFLGWLGIHWFYRGKVLLGFIFMFTLGIGFIGWIINTIILLLKVLSLKKKAKES